jgi:hypothetical protein
MKNERRPMAPTNPTTREEWQIAANLAQLVLLLQGFQLIKDDPRIEERCLELWTRARELGITPQIGWLANELPERKEPHGVQ